MCLKNLFAEKNKIFLTNLQHFKLSQFSTTVHIDYTQKGYTVPAKFGAHFLPCMKNDQKRTKMCLNEVGLTSTEFCKIQIQLRQPPIS